jgi:hypothetical protein
MSWVPLSNYSDGITLSDEPRRLTDEEIEYIVEQLPLVPSADYEAAVISRQGVVEWISETLRDVVLCPSAIPELISNILKQHYKSLVVPGTAIGTTAAEAVGATTTQMTLNTFHASGSAKSASFGIDAMRDIIFARKVPKNESCTIRYVNKRASYEEILNSRQYIVGSVVSDFIKDYDIEESGKLDRYWWHDVSPVLTGKKIPQSTLVLRLYLKIHDMYKQKVTIADLAETLEREAPPKVISVYGPMSDGIIDLYPDVNFIAETTKNKHNKKLIAPEYLELSYFETVVYPELLNMRVKGISGIKQLYPIVAPVWSIIAHERKLREDDLKNSNMIKVLKPYLGDAWVLYFNQNTMKTTGLETGTLASLCELAGVKVIIGLTKTTPGGKVIDDRIVVAIPYDGYRTQNGDVVITVKNNFYRKRDEVELINGEYYRVIEKSLLKEIPNGWIEKVDEKDKVEVTETLSSNDILSVNGKYYRKINLEDLLDINNVFYEKITNAKIEVEQMAPSKYVTEKITEAKRKYKQMLKEETDRKIKEAEGFSQFKKKRYVRTKSTVVKPEILGSAEYVYAETDGANLRGVLSLPQVDKNRTTCNNMHVIADTLGIEAARTFILRALHNTITNTGSYVNPANILFIAEFMTNRGTPYGATFTGIARGSGGHLSLATLERAGKVFIQNALNGRKEDIRNVSASVAVGSRMAIGDGMFDIAQNIGDKTFINDDLFKAGIQTAEKIPEADVMEELKSLKTVDDTFDFGEGEEMNLYTAFTGEGIVDVSLARQLKPHYGVQPPNASTPPSQLYPVIDTYKVATKDQRLPPKINYDPPTKTDLKSTGLVSITGVIPGISYDAISDELDDLMNMYRKDAQELLNLPVINFERMMAPSSAIELGREQVKGLIPTTKQ